MTTEQLLAKFNPANAANLSAQDLIDMRNLTDQQIDALANAYPNQPSRRAYLRLYDTTKADNKQLFTLSTWQNLRNVRKFSNMKNLVPYDFVASASAVQGQARQTIGRATGKAVTSPKKVVVDLSAREAAAELQASIDKKPDAQAKPATNVENKTTKPTAAKPATKAKPATSPKKETSPHVKAAPKANVENQAKPGATDGSEEFAPVN